MYVCLTACPGTILKCTGSLFVTVLFVRPLETRQCFWASKQTCKYIHSIVYLSICDTTDATSHPTITCTTYLRTLLKFVLWFIRHERCFRWGFCWNLCFSHWRIEISVIFKCFEHHRPRSIHFLCICKKNLTSIQCLRNCPIICMARCMWNHIFC